MASYSSYNGQKVHGSNHLLTTLLKEELGFDGVVLSDWDAVPKLDNGAYSGTAVAAAINAGIDIVIAPNKFEQVINACKTGVHNGLIKQERIDGAPSGRARQVSHGVIRTAVLAKNSGHWRTGRRISGKLARRVYGLIMRMTPASFTRTCRRFCASGPARRPRIS